MKEKNRKEEKGKGHVMTEAVRHWLAIVLCIVLLLWGGVWGLSAALAPKTAVIIQDITHMRIMDANTGAQTQLIDQPEPISRLTRDFVRLRLIRRAGAAEVPQWHYRIELYQEADLVQSIALIRGNGVWDGKAIYALSPGSWSQLSDHLAQLMEQYREEALPR